MVAVDDKGKRSGPSDYAAVARPFIFSKPPETAKVGTEFRYQVSAVRSLGDLRLRVVEGKEVASFWDIEKPRFLLVQGPSWLRIDESTGVLARRAGRGRESGSRRHGDSGTVGAPAG